MADDAPQHNYRRSAPRRDRPGRPSKLVPTVTEKLFEGIKHGLSYSLACARAGVDYSTFRRWIEKGSQQASGEYHDFCDELAAAEADGALVNVLRIKDASKKDWRAAAWLLEARHPDEYGRKRIEVTGKDGGPVESAVEATVQAQVEHTGEVQVHVDQEAIDLTRLTDAELDEFERLLARARRPDDDEAADAGGPEGGAPETA